MDDLLQVVFALFAVLLLCWITFWYTVIYTPRKRRKEAVRKLTREIMSRPPLRPRR